MKKLPLHDQHLALGAKTGEYAGYEMALYYSKPMDEHHATRQRGGVFDITHMGQFLLSGPQALALLQHALPNDVSKVVDGQALYSPLLKQDGGVLDDLIVYRYGQDRWRIIVNAGTKQKDFNWLHGLTSMFQAQLEDISESQCLLAAQGPQVFDLLGSLMTDDPGRLGYFRFTETRLDGVAVFMARTGYTGEPGVEISVARADAPKVWAALTEKLQLAPIGLAARDTLRLEACYPLYGNELKEEWNPLECGLGWAVKLNKGAEFIGRDALQAYVIHPPEYLQAAIEVTGRGIPRAGYPVLSGGKQVGLCTSGAMSPTTGRSIALARLQAPLAKEGTALEVEVRGKGVAAKVVKAPFFTNPALRQVKP